MRGGSVGMGGGGGVAERYEWKASASQRHSSATLAQNATTFMAASNRFSIYDKTLLILIDLLLLVEILRAHQVKLLMVMTSTHTK